MSNGNTFITARILYYKRNKRSKLDISNGALNLILGSGSAVVDLLFYVASIVCGDSVLVFVLKHKN